MGWEGGAIADETIIKSSGSTANHAYTCVYNMRSQLTDANITNIGGTWAAEYEYHKSGNMSSRTINLAQETFNYTGHQMTDADGNNLSYDENGNLTAGVDVNMVWNWDNMLRSAEKAGDSISLRYDPSGNRIFKDSSETGQRKYIVDIVGDLPVILLEIDPCNSMSIEKTYIYANSQILAQHDGDTSASRYFYLHDRLGSVREIIDTDANVVRMYTYEPFGKTLEEEGTLSNSFMFTGQYYDSEIGEYYLRARMYDSYLSRFTARDPAQGKFEEPLTLHRYLYCLNDAINKTDPSGEFLLLDLLFGEGTASKIRAQSAAIAFKVKATATSVVAALNTYYLQLNLLLERWMGSAAQWVSPEKGRQTMHGITYSKHALARMAPHGTRWWDTARRAWIYGRGVPPSVVENAILYGKRISEAGGITIFVYENVQVVMNSLTNTVITVKDWPLK